LKEIPKIINKIIFPQDKRLTICNVALKYPSLEVSGFLIGQYLDETIWINQVLFGKRKGWRERSFSLEANLLFEKKPTGISRVISVFHAHPKGCLLPSFWDIKSMIITQIPWLIFKINGGKMISRGYIYDDGLIKKIPIRIHR